MNIKRIFRAIKEPNRILKYLLIKNARLFPDELYLKMLFQDILQKKFMMLRIHGQMNLIQN